MPSSSLQRSDSGIFSQQMELLRGNLVEHIRTSVRSEASSMNKGGRSSPKNQMGARISDSELVSDSDEDSATELLQSQPRSLSIGEYADNKELTEENDVVK
jgi:hypothetical protein